AHRGAITVDSAPGRGSTFHLYFPQAAEHEPATAPSGWGDLGSLQRDGDARPGEGRHVLYIDDDGVMLLLVERLLLRLGYRVTGYADARSAIEAVRAQPHAFDLVVSDFNMPDLSGLDVAHAIGRLHAGLPVMISSGHLSDEQRVALLRCGVRDVISKENTLEELGPAVSRLVHGAEAAARRALRAEAKATPALAD
ncbi:MAG: response regulator, partial [Burkholderiaceae bacterium]